MPTCCRLTQTGHLCQRSIQRGKYCFQHKAKNISKNKTRSKTKILQQLGGKRYPSDRRRRSSQKPDNPLLPLLDQYRHLENQPWHIIENIILNIHDLATIQALCRTHKNINYVCQNYVDAKRHICWLVLGQQPFAFRLETVSPRCHQHLSGDRSFYGQAYRWMIWWEEYLHANQMPFQNNMPRFMANPYGYHQEIMQQLRNSGRTLDPAPPVVNPPRLPQ